MYHFCKLFAINNYDKNFYLNCCLIILKSYQKIIIVYLNIMLFFIYIFGKKLIKNL